MPSFLMPGDSLIESLPRLSPKPGHMPELVAAQGMWVAGMESAWRVVMK